MKAIDALSVNSIRVLAADAIQKATMRKSSLWQKQFRV